MGRRFTRATGAFVTFQGAYASVLIVYGEVTHRKILWWGFPIAALFLVVGIGLYWKGRPYPRHPTEAE